MAKFPYFKVVQFEKEFIVTKMDAEYLINHVDFEFRFPYKNSEKDIVTANKYINNLENKLDQEIFIKEKSNGIQRRTDLNRIEEIAKYIYESDKKSALFPTPIVLGVNVYEDDKKLVKYDTRTNELEFSEENTKFTIIDGQHRLLGIARYAKKYNSEINIIDIPIILFADINLQEATKLFININANQKKVNKSLVFDLYENINEPIYDKIKNIKTVVQALNENTGSVLNNKIKMLGTGEGTVSLAFMIDYIDSEILHGIDKFDKRELLINLNRYFSTFKTVFSDDWHTLLKTTGMGAMLMYYPIAEKKFGDFMTDEALQSLKSHLEDKGKIDYSEIIGSGKKAQNHLKDKFV